MRAVEPCLCGDPYCGRCFPGGAEEPEPLRDDQRPCAWCGEAFDVYPWAGNPELEPADEERFCSRSCGLQFAGYDF